MVMTRTCAKSHGQNNTVKTLKWKQTGGQTNGRTNAIEFIILLYSPSAVESNTTK